MGRQKQRDYLANVLMILVLNVSKKEKLVTNKENLHLCSWPRVHTTKLQGVQ
jgi:hypothetical protein